VLVLVSTESRESGEKGESGLGSRRRARRLPLPAAAPRHYKLPYRCARNGAIQPGRSSTFGSRSHEPLARSALVLRLHCKTGALALETVKSEVSALWSAGARSRRRRGQAEREGEPAVPLRHSHQSQCQSLLPLLGTPLHRPPRHRHSRPAHALRLERLAPPPSSKSWTRARPL